MTGTATGRRASRACPEPAEGGVGPVAVAAIVGAALLAIAAAALWLADSPAAPEQLEEMGCKDLAAAMLDGDDAERRAALSVYVKKKCI